MRLLVLLIALFVPTVLSFKTNRTSCFHYVSCLESIQSNLKECAGGAAISLTLEAKDVNIRDLVKYRALEFVGCQDRLLKEVVDFEALQILVNEDARECFEKLPESSKRVEQFTDSCDYVQPLSRNSSKGDALQCLIEFKQDREYCESLLECCPDHTRCGERMNAVSLSYQNARVKAEQIVYSMISCIVVNDPRFLREGARLQSLRDPYRNAGVPFLRPDAYTEARITRRLALTSTATLSQRRERFLKKYTQVRQVVTQNLFSQQNSKAVLPVEDVVTESSKTLEPEKEEVVGDIKKISETGKSEETAESSSSIITSTTAVPNQEESLEANEKTASDVHVNTIRNLIRNASDRDLSKYVALISEGKFSELFELAEKKKVTLTTKFGEKLSAKMFKLKELITEALSEKSSEIEKPSDKFEKAIVPELIVMEENTEGNPKGESSLVSDKLPKLTSMQAETRLAHTVVDRTSRNVAEAENSASFEDGIKTVTETAVEKPVKTESKVEIDFKKPPKDNVADARPETQKKLTKVFDDKERALLVESEIKKSADQTRVQTIQSLKSEEVPVITDDLPVLEKEDSAEKKEDTTTTMTSTTVETTQETVETTTKVELLSNPDDVLTVPQPMERDVEGSGEEVEEEKNTTISEPVVSGGDVIANVKRIRPRTEQTHCQQYATCWQTVMDYEQQCDRKYSTEVLSHGIDDSEILSILQNSSISHHEIVLKACLRPLDRSTHSTLKQLLVIQRGVRKACLDLGRNKIAVTDAEEALCSAEVPTTAAIDEFISSVHVRSQANHLTCRAKLEPIREACSIVRSCCASVETCDNYISSSPVKKLETEAVRRLVKRQNDCETKMLQTLTYIHEQLSNPSRRRRFYYH